jgi:hypothetical protein
MSFTKFTATNSKYETRLSISRSNSIGIPTQFYRDERVADYRFAVLYYDPEETRIAVRFTNDETEKGRFSITKSRDHGGTVVAASFFRGNKIDAKSVYGKYEPVKAGGPEIGVDEPGTFYVISLKSRPIGAEATPKTVPVAASTPSPVDDPPTTAPAAIPTIPSADTNTNPQNEPTLEAGD